MRAVILNRAARPYRLLASLAALAVNGIVNLLQQLASINRTVFIYCT